MKFHWRSDVFAVSCSEHKMRVFVPDGWFAGLLLLLLLLLNSEQPQKKTAPVRINPINPVVSVAGCCWFLLVVGGCCSLLFVIVVGSCW